MKPYRGEPYKAITPITADNEDLAKQGQRVILYHQYFGAGLYQAKIYVAPKREVTSGWVIGLIVS